VADIDKGGLDAACISSSENRIGWKMLPGVDGPPNDFDSNEGPTLPVFPLLSHDKVRRRGVLYSPPDASVREDRKE